MIRRLALAILGLCLPLAASAAEPSREALEFFEKQIRPVLAENCFNCHNADKQKGNLRLDSRQAMLVGGDTGPVIVPGKPEVSLLVKAIHYEDDGLRMPPKGKLKAEQIVSLKKWIADGAPWPEMAAAVRPVVPTREFQITAKERAFWSFQPIRDPALPPVRDNAWPQRSLDRFILAKLEDGQVRPVAPADKRTLLRRVTFDLTGLPPTPAELDAFLADNSPEAFARVVDRLLASPHYGERWARHWLDVARYGEDQAHTFQSRKYPNGYRYRDWLVRSFNDDLPYNEFVKQQLAADLLPGPDQLERLPALGFFACGPVYYGDAKKLDQYDDRIDTLSRGLLGLTVSCARCHDHKFDPISTRDYYSLVGVIASSEYEEVPLVPPEVVEEAKKKQSEADKKNKVQLNIPVVHALKDAATPVTMRVHVRGNPETLGEEAPRRFLSILGGHPFPHGSGRLDLAEAITNPKNPLTARVLVNRVWKQHFGQGLVRTPSNFGALGERPTHPDLLDHLATFFIRSGWSLKALHREILLSATYQLGSQVYAGNLAIDPDNRTFWRMNRRRLEVEAWRDAMLAVADTMDSRLGGPSQELNLPNNRRRTLYGHVSRHELNSLLRLFDFPDPNVTSEQRTQTTVPLQQLFVLNSEFIVRNARALANKLSQQPGTDAERIARAFPLLYARPASDREIQLGLAFLAAAEDQTGLKPWEQYAQVLLSANEFLYVD